MKKKYIFAFVGFVAMASGLFAGCSLFGSNKENEQPYEQTYNVNYFNYTLSGESLPYGAEIDNSENLNTYKTSEGLVLVNPTCTGWVFDGWYEGVYWSTPSTLCWDDAVLITEIEAGRTNNIILYGKWHRGEFSIIFNAGAGNFDGGVKTKSLSFEYEEEVDISSLETPTRDEYELYAWENLPQTMPAENITLNAVWSKVYNVSYVLDTDVNLQTEEITWSWNNDEENPTEYSLASNIKLKSATTTRPGYAFGGWYLDNGFTKGISTIKEENIPEGSEELVLYAKWEKFFSDLDAGTVNSLNALGRRQKEIKIPNKYIDDNGNVKTITQIGGGGSSIFSATIGYTVPQVEKLIVDEGITSISNSAFYQTNSLKEVVLPSTITRIGNNSFNGCGNLSAINLADTFVSLTSIGSSAFTGTAIDFGKISFDEKLNKIYSNAFSMCLVTEIEIYSNTNVEGGAFGYCYNLEKVTVKQAQTQGSVWVDSSAFILGFDNNIGDFEVVFDSVYAYASSKNTYSTDGNYFGYIHFAKTVKVKKDFVDNVIKAYEDRDNINNYLNDETIFIKTESGDYYVYERIQNDI